MKNEGVWVKMKVGQGVNEIEVQCSYSDPHTQKDYIIKFSDVSQYIVKKQPPTPNSHQSQYDIFIIFFNRLVLPNQSHCR